MTRLRGRCRKGARLIDYVPHGHWKTTTFVAGLRNDAIVAPLVLDRPMNGAAFQAWLDQGLCPTLSPGDIVIMDNLPAHKVAGVRGHHRSYRRTVVIPAALFARPQSHRADVRQTQSPATQIQRAHDRRPLGPGWRTPRRILPHRMLKLSQARRLRFKIDGECSSCFSITVIASEAKQSSLGLISYDLAGFNQAAPMDRFVASLLAMTYLS